MKKKNSIDTLFQRAFENFKAKPDESNWDVIKKDLIKRRRKDRKVFWYKASGFAALLIVLLISGYLLGPGTDHNLNITHTKKAVEENSFPLKSSKSNQVNPTQVTFDRPSIEYNDFQESRQLNRPKLKPVVPLKNQPWIPEQPMFEKTAAQSSGVQNRQNEPLLSAPVLASAQKKNVNHQVEQKTNAQKAKLNKTSPSETQTGFDKKNKSEPDEQWAAQTSDNETKDLEFPRSHRVTSVLKTAPVKTGGYLLKQIDQIDTLKLLRKSKKSLLVVAEALKNDEESPDVNKEERSMLWSFKPNASPVFYNSFNGGNAIDPRFNRNKSRGEVTVSYGLNVAYAVSEKIKIRSGINKVNTSYKTQNIKFFQSATAIGLKGVDINEASQNIQLASTASGGGPSSVTSKFGETSDLNNTNDGNMQQNFGFLEVPLEVEYKLIDSRLGLNLIGGASTFFLNQNNIQLESRFGTRELGESTQINSTSFSANIGLGLDYSLTSTFDLSFEPTFKYQINTFNEASNFNPYILGLYTGVRFKF